MFTKHRNLLIIIALLAIIGTGLYQRSYYIRTDGKYLLEFDTYYHYRMAKTILEQGTRPAWDTMAFYPTGSPVQHPPLFHYYLAYSYEIVSSFSDMSLYQWCIYANTIPIILAIIAAFYAGKILTNDVGGLFTALFVAVNGAIASRTVIGYTDTDIWIVLFSFVAVYFLFKALKSERRYEWALLLGLTLFFFTMTWSGYTYLVLLVFAVFLICVVADVLKKQFDRSLLSAFALSFLSFVLPWTLYEKYYLTGVVLAALGASWLFAEKFTRVRKALPAICVAIIGVTVKVLYDEKVLSAVFGTSKRLVGTSTPQGQGFIIPDISISILQRYTVTFPIMLQLFSVLLVIAPFGIIFLLQKKDKFTLRAVLCLGLYFAGTGALLLMGGRYTMLFAIPLILSAGAFFGRLPEILERRVTSKGVLAAVIVCGLSAVPCYTAGAQLTKIGANMNDDMWELLTWMSENTPQDAVIIANWDLGYWIESIAQRKTVMNGSHYDISWRVVKYGKMLETQDETVAMKEVYGFPTMSEVESLREFPADSEWAKEKEMAGFAEDDAYVLVSEWTMLTFYWNSYFGNWNYATGEGQHRIYDPMWSQTARKLAYATEYVYGTQNIGIPVIKENGNFHSFILEKNGYAPTLGTIFHKDGELHFLGRKQGGLGIIYVPPHSLQYFKTTVAWPDMPGEVFLIKAEDIECMLTKLYFLNGGGLQYFELVKDCGTAKLYKVHKVAQVFDQGIIMEEDTYAPV